MTYVVLINKYIIFVFTITATLWNCNQLFWFVYIWNYFAQWPKKIEKNKLKLAEIALKANFMQKNILLFKYLIEVEFYTEPYIFRINIIKINLYLLDLGNRNW